MWERRLGGRVAAGINRDRLVDALHASEATTGFFLLQAARARYDALISFQYMFTQDTG